VLIKERSLFGLKRILISVVLFVTVAVSNLNAETIVYIDNNPIEDAYYRITVDNGTITSTFRIDENGVVQ